MTDPDLTVATLGRLPRLARTPPPPQAPAARHTPHPGPKLPPGADAALSRLDVDRQHPDQLARIGQCVRAVCEEAGFDTLPDLAPEGHQTWASECAWLVDTAESWRDDAWCSEWIGTEVADVERKLLSRAHRAERTTDKACPVCGVELTAYTTDSLMVACCPQCERVAGMRPRLTEAQRRAAILDGARRLLRRMQG